MRQFDAERVLQLIEAEKVTLFAGVPTMYQMLTRAPNWPRADLSSLRFCVSGGAALPLELVDRYMTEKGVRFKQGFGMTEFGPGVFALAPEDAMRKAGSIGRPNFFVDARIVDPDGDTVGPGEVGELLLRGPSCCSGYFDPDGRRLPVTDKDGWLRTGDLARRDEDGYYYVVDRKKDMFISGGENVYPTEIEQALYRHPAVQMCAVIGVPEPKWGEVGKACVLLKPGATATPEELIAHMQNHLARYKVPHSVEIMETLPISAAGKILKRELRQRFVKG
jgi:fatty-acyl-CoA synthase